VLHVLRNFVLDSWLFDTKATRELTDKLPFVSDHKAKHFIPGNERVGDQGSIKG
jgi:hypothetical protein